MKNDSISAAPAQVLRLVPGKNGVRLQSSFRGMSTGGNVGRRGRVSGFSRASARRLRHLLFGLDYSGAIAVTLTHPIWQDIMRGPEASFGALCRDVSRFRWLRCLVWRKEVQQNGTPHYHTILWPSPGVSAKDAAENLLTTWINSCLVNFASGDAKADVFREMVRRDMDTAHHDPNSPSYREMDGSCYVRYILDHESKHKQEQAKTTGRAWGVINRSRLPIDGGIAQGVELEEWQYWAAARLLRRVTRYSIKAPCCFGWKHSRGRRAHGVGSVDYFSRRADGSLAAQIVAYVLALPAPSPRPLPSLEDLTTPEPSPRQMAKLVLEDIAAGRGLW